MVSLDRLKNTAKELLKLGRTEEAIAWLERALSLTEKEEDAVQADILRGTIHLARREYRDALARYDCALEIDFSNEEAQHWRVAAIRALAAQESGDRRPEIHLTASVGAYRRLAGDLPCKSDVVIELGASTGRTTRILAASAGRVVAVEKTTEMFERAKAEVRQFDSVVVICSDARDMPRVLASVARVDLLFVDIGGSAGPWQTMGLAKRYLRTVYPRGLVLRNTELNDFVASLTFFEKDRRARWG